MRFSIIYLIGAAAALANAAAIHAQAADMAVIGDVTAELNEAVPVAELETEAELDSEDHLEKRQTAAYVESADRGAQAGEQLPAVIGPIIEKLLPIGNWNSAREAFTKSTVTAMWASNPDRNRWVAVACYNKAWDVANPAGISDVASVKLTRGLLHTDYSCFYMGRNNALWTRGDGGFINLATQYDHNVCSFDSSTSDLTCR